MSCSIGLLLVSLASVREETLFLGHFAGPGFQGAMPAAQEDTSLWESCNVMTFGCRASHSGGATVVPTALPPVLSLEHCTPAPLACSIVNNLRKHGADSP